MKKAITLLALFSMVAYAQNTFADPRDGKKYKSVKIGNQTWLAENLVYNASGSKCYEDKNENCTQYGRLYNWDAAKTACPDGWHLPSKGEYELLDKAVGGEKVAGNEFGFSALPGGYGLWWSSSEGNSNSAYYRYKHHSIDSALWNLGGKSGLLSVRCLQD